MRDGPFLLGAIEGKYSRATPVGTCGHGSALLAGPTRAGKERRVLGRRILSHDLPKMRAADRPYPAQCLASRREAPDRPEGLATPRPWPPEFRPIVQASNQRATLSRQTRLMGTEPNTKQRPKSRT